MKKFLLNPPSKLVRFYFRTLAVLVLFLGIASSAQAQCSLYEHYNSGTLPAGYATGGPLGFVPLSPPSPAAGAVSATPRTGTQALNSTDIGNFVETPTISNPDVFSFWMKRNTGSGAFYDLQINDGVNGWQSLKNAASLINYGITTYSFPGGALELTAPGVNLTNAWQRIFVKFDGVPASGYGNTNLKFRIVDNRNSAAFTTRIMWLDDISWSSKTPALNTLIIPQLNVVPACSSTIAPSDPTYTLFDVGGEYDFYNFTQDNNLTFTPTAGNKLLIKFISFDAEAGDVITVSGGTPTLTNYTGFTNPTNVSYFGAIGTPMSVRFQSDATLALKAGFRIEVKCVPGSFCFEPLGVNAATAVTSSTASASWVAAAGPPAGYDIYYDTSNAAIPGTPNFTNVNSPFVMTGLTSGTTYYYWVRSNCGGTQSTWIGPSVAFTTLCAPINPTYTENFNGQPTSALPNCTSADNASWQVNTVNGYLTNNLIGTNFFTKAVNLVGGTEYRLSYDYGSALGDLDLRVYYGQTVGLPSTLNITTPLNTNLFVTGLTNAVVNFTPASSGIYYIRFELTRTSAAPSTFLILDNINLSAEICGPGRTLVASGVTASAATINWIVPAAPYAPPASGYQYFLSTSSATPAYSASPTGTTGAGVTTAFLIALTSSTQYYIWVRSNCSGYLSAWSVPISFTTLAGATPLILDATTNGTTKTACDYSFFDSGGSTGNYQNNEDYTVTVTPSTPGTKVKVVFGTFSTENGFDGLSIYNGATTAFPLIGSGLPVGFNAATCPAGSFYGTVSPGTIISSAADGSLTFRFTTDFSVLSSGWSAFVSCVIAPTITSFTPTNNNCGAAGTVVITGTNFFVAPNPNAITGVSFNGTPAAFVVNSPTQITATIPVSPNSGTISVSNSTATGFSATSFAVLAPPPVTTGVVICTGGAGSLTTSTVCNGFVNSGTSITGTLNAGTDLTAPRPSPPGGNSTTCSFLAGSIRNYQSVQFQVSVSGNYVFQMASPYDAMGYITSGPFTPGSCATGTYIVGDDDSNGGLQPRMTISLVAGVTYTLYTTSWGGSGTVSGAYTWTVTPPTSGQIMLQGIPTMNWYVVASLGSPIGTGSSFNPVGVLGSGLANTNTAITRTYYAACSSNPTCRAATTFVINARPTITFTAEPGASACTFNDVTYTTQAGQTNYIWNVPGILGTDYTITSGGIGTTSNTVTLQWLTTGTKTVTINYTNASNCPAATPASSIATSVTPSVASTVTPNAATVCANVPQILTATSGTANFFTWTTTSGALFTDAACTVPYVALTNFATVYFKGLASATVTVLGTIGGTGCSAASTAAITVSTAIWTGSWSNGTGPTNAISAEFQGNFTSSINASGSAGNLAACSVVVTSGNVLFDQGTLTVPNTVTVNAGSLVFDDTNFDVSLYQSNNVVNGAGIYSGGNSGNITFNRTAAPMFKFDYTYWSTPVNPQNLLAVSPGSPINLFLNYTTGWNYIASPGTTTMEVGRGYIIRAPNSYPVSPGTPQEYLAPFIGVPNNGDISVPIIGGAAQFNFIGNPYPSALFANSFIGANANIGGTLYFWTHNTPINASLQYALLGDYASYNLSGGLAASNSGAGNNSIPVGYVASGQGFFVKGLTSSPALFTNTMRSAGNNNQFYRSSANAPTTNSDLERHRYWLNITNTGGAFKQALVAYVETATLGMDRLFDGDLVEGGNVITLYTKVADTKLSIQGRPLPFDSSDTVPLSYKSTIASTYTITIPQYDGLFTSQHVYLEDRLLNVIHDLTEGSYTFATEIGTFEDRFLLRYTTETLGTDNPVFDENSVVVYKIEQGLLINSGNAIMKAVTIYDIRGSVIATQKQVGSATTVFTTLPTTQQVLLVRIQDENGAVVTKKVVY